jgi:hypothetical protein
MNIIAYGKSLLEGLCPPPRKMRREPLPTGYGTHGEEKIIKKTQRAVDILEGQNQKVDFARADPSRFRQLSEKMLDPNEIYFQRRLNIQGEEADREKPETRELNGPFSRGLEVDGSKGAGSGDGGRWECPGYEVEQAGSEKGSERRDENWYYTKKQVGLSVVRERSCEETVQDIKVLESRYPDSSKASKGGSISGKLDEENSQRKLQFFGNSYYMEKKSEPKQLNGMDYQQEDGSESSSQRGVPVSERKLKTITGAKKVVSPQVHDGSQGLKTSDHFAKSEFMSISPIQQVKVDPPVNLKEGHTVGTIEAVQVPKQGTFPGALNFSVEKSGDKQGQMYMAESYRRGEEGEGSRQEVYMPESEVIKATRYDDEPQEEYSLQIKESVEKINNILSEMKSGSRKGKGVGQGSTQKVLNLPTDMRISEGEEDMCEIQSISEDSNQTLEGEAKVKLVNDRFQQFLKKMDFKGFGKEERIYYDRIENYSDEIDRQLASLDFTKYNEMISKIAIM